MTRLEVMYHANSKMTKLYVNGYLYLCVCIYIFFFYDGGKEAVYVQYVPKKKENK